MSKLSCVAKVIIDFQCQDRNPEGDKLVTTRDSCQNTFLRVAKYESFFSSRTEWSNVENPASFSYKCHPYPLR